MNYADRKKMVMARRAIDDYENMPISGLSVKELRKLVADIVTDVVDNTQHRKNVRDNENRRAAGLLPYPSPSEFAVMGKWGDR
jgi:hypothetical protein